MYSLNDSNTTNGGTLNDSITPIPPAPTADEATALQYQTKAHSGFDRPSSRPQQSYAPPRPRPSGYRIASGIIGIALGLSLLLQSGMALSASTDGSGFLAFMLLVAALGVLTSTIVLLAKRRKNEPGTPIILLSFTMLGLLLALISLTIPYLSVVPLIINVPLALPTLILMGLGLAKERDTRLKAAS
jgi:hypothetical protein